MPAQLKVRDGSPDQFVLLKIARDIAARAGDATTALSAVKELVQRFDVSPVKLPAETLLTAAEQAGMTAQRKAVAEAARGIIAQLAEADEYELAIRVCDAGRLAAQGVREFKLDLDESATLIVVQRNRPDRFFAAAQQKRLEELMARCVPHARSELKARDCPNDRPPRFCRKKRGLLPCTIVPVGQPAR